MRLEIKVSISVGWLFIPTGGEGPVRVLGNTYIIWWRLMLRSK